MNAKAIQDQVVADVLAERARQDAKWGQQDNDPFTYLAVLTEEVGELAQAALHTRFGGSAAAGLRTEALHTAAVALALVECLDRGLWRWPDQAERPERLAYDHRGVRQTLPISLDPHNVPDPVVGELSICLMCGVTIEFTETGEWIHRIDYRATCVICDEQIANTGNGVWQHFGPIQPIRHPAVPK